MPLWQVVGHSAGQLKMIYEAYLLEQAERQMRDLNNLAAVASAVNGGKAGAAAMKKHTDRLQSVLDGKARKGKTDDGVGSNRAAHIARLRLLGAT